MAVSNADILNFLNANPGMDDAGIASAMQQYGVSPEQMAQATGSNVADITARFEAATASPAIDYYAQQFGEDTSAQTPVAAAVNPEIVLTPEQIKALDEFMLNPTITFGDITVSGEEVKKYAAIDKVAQQILAQGTTDKWSGQGKGSAEANAADMAKILVDTGITDIKDFGKVTTYAPVEEIAKTYNGEVVRKIYNEDDGTTTNVVMQRTGQYDYDGNEMTTTVVVPPTAKLETVYGQYVDGGGEYGGSYSQIDPSKIVIKDGQAVTAVGETFGNKVTGQAVANTYGERQTDNAFGGTYAGKGNTGYRVQFNADGSPIFYTTAASSSNIGDLAPILAIASFIPTLAPFAQAINAAIAIDRGDILGGIASLAGVAGLSEVSTGLKVVNALDKGDAMGIVGALMSDPGLGKLASTTMIADGISFADAGNALKVIDNLDKGNITGALSTAANMTGSADAQTAAAGLNLINAAKTGDFTQIAGAANGLNNTLNATNNVVQQVSGTGKVNNSGAASFADFNLADDTDTQISNQINQSLIFNGSGATDINAAAAAAQNAGLDKFTFGGGTYTLDNNNAAATITDLERIVASDKLAATTKTNLAGGEFAGVDAAVAANTRANNVVIGNAEADNLDQAAYLAKLRNPTGTTFTFDGNTYTMGTSNADVNAALATTRRDTALQDIQNAPKFGDAYASARALLGPNQTFTWQGKQYSTATSAERPDLNITAADNAIAALNASNLSTTTNASGTVAAQNDTLARIIAGGPDQSSAETNRLRIKNEELDLANAKQKADAAQAAIESVFGKGTAANVVIQGLSNIQQASGQTLDFIGGTGAALGLTKADNALTNAGQSMTRTGESLQLESVNQANANVIDAVNKADGLGAKIIAGAKAIYENPLSINMAAIEVLQEALPMGLALKSVKLLGKLGAVGLDMGLNAIESGGAAYNDKYRDAIKAGKTVEQADAEGMSAFYIASAVTVATAGVVDTAVINKITKSVEKAASKTATGVAKEGGSEFGEEFLTSAITDYALTGKVDLNKALTQGVVGGFVAGKTTGSIDAASNLSNSVSDVQQTFTKELNDAGLKSFDGSNNISSLVDSKTNIFVAPEDVTSTLTNAGLIDTSNISLSPAMQYAAANNTSQQQVYDAINGWLAANPEASQAEIITAMSSAGVDIGDVVAAMSSKVTATNVANTANAATTGSTTGATTGSTTGATTGSTTGTTTGTTGSLQEPPLGQPLGRLQVLQLAQRPVLLLGLQRVQPLELQQELLGRLELLAPLQQAQDQQAQ